MKLKFNTRLLILLGSLIIILFSSCDKYIGYRFLNYNKGYRVYKLDFLDGKPEAEIQFKNNSKGETGWLGVGNNNFQKILLSFISVNELNPRTGGCLLLIDGFLREKKEIKFNDIKAITTFRRLEDNSIKITLFIKDKKSDKFVEYDEDEDENEELTGLTNKYKTPALKDSPHSYLKILNFDVLEEEDKNEPSPKTCVPKGAKYLKMDFDFLSEVEGLNVLCYNTDTVQFCRMSLQKKYFINGLDKLLPDADFDVIPFRYIIYLNGHVNKKEEIKAEEIKAILTTEFNKDDEHFYHSLFLRNSENYFDEIPDFNFIEDSLDTANSNLIARTLVLPEISENVCSYIEIKNVRGEYYFYPTTERIYEFKDKFNTYLIKYKKNNVKF